MLGSISFATVAGSELNHSRVKPSRRWGSIDRKWEGRVSTEEMVGTFVGKKTTKHQVVETHGGERESCGRWDDLFSSSKGSAFP